MDLSERTTDEQAELTRISQALAPDFKILGELGRGGMGERELIDLVDQLASQITSGV